MFSISGYPSNLHYVTEDQFDFSTFQGNLKTKYLGRCFLYRRVTTSTMDVSLKEGFEGAPHGTLILAEQQTQGKARKDNRTWDSPASGNLYFTLILRSRDFESFKKAHFAAPIAVVKACADHGVNASAKWPNDVWCENKKLSGMIQPIESVQDESQYAGTFFSRLGVGININQDMSKTSNAQLQASAISVSQVLKKQISREIFLAQVLNHLESLIGSSMENVLEEYKKVDLLCGKKVVIKPKGVEEPESYTATVLSVLENGQLRIQRADNNQVVDLMNEEIEMIRPAQL